MDHVKLRNNEQQILEKKKRTKELIKGSFPRVISLFV